jgi:hypothetical protein
VFNFLYTYEGKHFCILLIGLFGLSCFDFYIDNVYNFTFPFLFQVTFDVLPPSSLRTMMFIKYQILTTFIHFKLCFLYKIALHFVFCFLKIVSWGLWILAWRWAREFDIIWSATCYICWWHHLVRLIEDDHLFFTKFLWFVCCRQHLVAIFEEIQLLTFICSQANLDQMNIEVHPSLQHESCRPKFCKLHVRYNL